MNNTLLKSIIINSMTERWESFLWGLNNVLLFSEPDPIHDLRVSIRRLNATFVLFKVFWGEKKYSTLIKPSRNKIKKLLKISGSLRDVHIKREIINKNFLEIQSNNFLSNFLQKEKEKEEILLHDFIILARQFPIDNVKYLMETTISENKTYIKKIEKANKKIKKIKIQLLSNAKTANLYAKSLLTNVLRNWEELNKNPYDSGVLHQMRINLKKYRYTVEVLSPILCITNKNKIENMKNMQTLMGEIHDYDVLVEEIKNFDTMGNFVAKDTETEEERSKIIKILNQKREALFTDFMLQFNVLKNML